MPLRLLLLPALLPLCLPLHASEKVIPKLQEHIAWGSQGEHVFLPISSEDPVKVLSQGKTRYLQYSPSPGCYSAGWSFGQDALYIRTGPILPEDTSKLGHHLWRQDIQSKEDVWNKIGQIQQNSDYPNGGLSEYFVPLQKSDFFVGFWGKEGFSDSKGKQAGFVARYRNREGRIEFTDLIPLPFGKYEDIARHGGTSFQAKAVHVALTPNLEGPPVATKDYLALVATRAGVIWFLSAETGEHRRTINLSGLKEDELDNLEFLNHYILGIQPMKDGRFLVASRHPDTLGLLKIFYRDRQQGPASQVKALKDYLKAAEAVTDILWWIIDPLDWSVEKVEDPATYPAKAISYKHLNKFTFILDEKGKVIHNHAGSWKDQRPSLLKEQLKPEPSSKDSMEKAVSAR